MSAARAGTSRAGLRRQNQRRAASKKAAQEPTPRWTGVADAGFTRQPVFQTGSPGFPVLRQLERNGKLTRGAKALFDWDTARRMYGCMVRSEVYDTALNDMQRQGRISFYCTNFGEEAASVGTAAALAPQDMIWPQYRELAMFLWRGLTAQNIVDACIGNEGDQGKGRNLPVHYMLPEANVQAVHAVLGTQVPQAPGAGYAYRLRVEDRISVAYFGDGAASEGDSLSALNYAALFKSQTLFICRNNGYSISTPVGEQYTGDGVAARGAAFDIPSCRVDGNDAVAVYHATAMARKLIIEERRPALLELMTYRRGHHTTSDDSTLYRPEGELQGWAKEGVGPVCRFRSYLVNAKQWDDEREGELRSAAMTEIRQALRAAEAKRFSNPKELFTDTFDELPWHLREQLESMQRHVAANRQSYKCDRYSGL